MSNCDDDKQRLVFHSPCASNKPILNGISDPGPRGLNFSIGIGRLGEWCKFFSSLSSATCLAEIPIIEISGMRFLKSPLYS